MRTIRALRMKSILVGVLVLAFLFIQGCGDRSDKEGTVGTGFGTLTTAGQTAVGDFVTLTVVTDRDSIAVGDFVSIRAIVTCTAVTPPSKPEACIQIGDSVLFSARPTSPTDLFVGGLSLPITFTVSDELADLDDDTCCGLFLLGEGSFDDPTTDANEFASGRVEERFETAIVIEAAKAGIAVINVTVEDASVTTYVDVFNGESSVRPPGQGE